MIARGYRAAEIPSRLVSVIGNFPRSDAKCEKNDYPCTAPRILSAERKNSEIFKLFVSLEIKFETLDSSKYSKLRISFSWNRSWKSSKAFKKFPRQPKSEGNLSPFGFDGAKLTRKFPAKVGQFFSPLTHVHACLSSVFFLPRIFSSKFLATG